MKLGTNIRHHVSVWRLQKRFSRSEIKGQMHFCGGGIHFGDVASRLACNSFIQRCMECRRGLTIRCLSVRPSVSPSVKRVHCDKTEERYV